MKLKPKLFQVVVFPLSLLLGVFSHVRAEACPMLTLPLDAALVEPTSFSRRFDRDVALFSLRGLVAWDQAGAVIDAATRFEVVCDDLFAQAAGPLARSRDPGDGTLDPGSIRETFESLHLQTIAQRGQDEWIRPTVANLVERTDYKSWTTTLVPRSSIKRKTRRIYRSPAGFVPEISVAETLDSEVGDEAASILETEVAIARRGSGAGGGEGQWDFYAYDEAGNLADYSTFPAGRRAAPQICISCHYDSSTRSVSKFLRRE